MARLWPYKAPGIVDLGSYDISIVCGSKDMNLQNLFLFHKNINTVAVIINFCIE